MFKVDSQEKAWFDQRYTCVSVFMVSLQVNDIGSKNTRRERVGGWPWRGWTGPAMWPAFLSGNTVHNCRRSNYRGRHRRCVAAYLHNLLLHYQSDACSSPVLGSARGGGWNESEDSSGETGQYSRGGPPIRLSPNFVGIGTDQTSVKAIILHIQSGTSLSDSSG
jgi:hypothetical protein